MHRSTPVFLTAISFLMVGLVFGSRSGAQTDCDTPHCGPYSEDTNGGCLGPDDPFCSGGGSEQCQTWIGGGWCTGSDNGTDWTTTCWSGEPPEGEAECLAQTFCDDGSIVQCEGDYTAKADIAGVRCQDTGSDLGTTDYCP